MPGTVPKWGLRTSGERPRQPFTHSLEPAGRKGSRGPKSFGYPFRAFIPSSSVRFSQFAHFAFPESTSMSIQRSSGSQSPVWIACEIMSG